MQFSTLGEGTCPAGVTRNFVSEYWNDRASLSMADSLPVTEDSVTENISPVLAAGAQLTVKVTKPGGDALEDSTLTVYREDGTTAASGFKTGADGTRTYTGLRPGNYKVRARGALRLQLRHRVLRRQARPGVGRSRSARIR